MKYRGLLILAVLMAASCFYLYRAEKTDTKDWLSTGISRFNAQTENGAITVLAQAAAGIEADITRSCMGTSHAEAEKHLDDIVLSDSVGGSDVFLRADLPGASARNYNCEFDVRTPAACAQNLSTTNGAVTVNGISADVNLETSNGAVTLSGVAGAIHAQTTNGAVTLTGTSGPAVVVTTNGQVTLAPHEGSIDARTSSGAIDCDLIRFDTFDTAVLHTSNGRVMVSLPSDVSVTFDAATSNGEVGVEGFTVNYTLNDHSHKRGSIGGGKATLNIVTSNGQVTIRPR